MRPGMILRPRALRDGEMLAQKATRTVTVTNPHGLHVRPCLAIVTALRNRQAKVTIHSNGQAADAASLLDLLSLGATQGTELVLSAEGPQADKALDALAELFANEFAIDYKS